MKTFKPIKSKPAFYFIKENTWLPRRNGLDFGWGCGYVALPPYHSLHNKDYAEIEDDVYIHGGLTFSSLSDHLEWPELKNIKNFWIIGFDTAHYGDTLSKWPKHRVEEETKLLFEQLNKLE